MPRRAPTSSSLHLLLLLLVRSTLHVHSDSIIQQCDEYEVQLQATYPDNVVIPCTDEQYRSIEALIQALVQVDVIVGLNAKPVRDFFIAFETYGTEVTVSPVFDDEQHFTTSQLDMASPFLLPEDHIEDIYYGHGAYYHSAQNDTSVLETPIAGMTDVNNDESNSDMGNVDEMSVYSEEDNVKIEEEPPLIGPYEDELNDYEHEQEGPIEPYEDSLRNGIAMISADEKGTRGRRKLMINVTTTSSTSTTSNTQEEDTIEVEPQQQVAGCEKDWCGYFLSRPCEMIPHNPYEEDSLQYQEQIKKFQERVADSIERKLRKWARDTNCMCLGNSWELQAFVQKLG